MAAIVDRLKKQMKEQNLPTAGVQTISECFKALGGVRKGEDVAEAVNSSVVEISEPEE